MASRALSRALRAADLPASAPLARPSLTCLGTNSLAKALAKIGFRTGPVWHQVNVGHAAEEMEAQFRFLNNDLVAGIPSIICTRYDERP